MKYFYINLDNANERRSHIETEFMRHSCKFYRVEAIHFTEFMPKNETLNSLKNAKETACHKSHMKAIKEFIDSNDEYGVICEDDLTYDYKPYWKCDPEELIKQMPTDTGVIQLCVIYSAINRDRIWHEQPTFFKWGTIPHVGSCLAYIITRKCAIELYNYFESLPKQNSILPPADSTRGIYGNVNTHTNYVTYTYKYPMFTYRDNNDTQLGNCLNNQESSKRQVHYFLTHFNVENKI